VKEIYNDNSSQNKKLDFDFAGSGEEGGMGEEVHLHQ